MNSVLLIERTHHLDMKPLAAKNISVAIIKKFENYIDVRDHVMFVQ